MMNMNEPKFTPAPWAVSKDDDDQFVVIMASAIEDEYDHYCCHKWTCEVTHHEVGEIGDDETPSNAHLIAAAPDMYAMLEAIEAGNGQPNCDDILALLAKARGESV